VIRALIVAIEGLDGVGKTTVAGLLRSSLSDCEVLHTPPRAYYDGNIEILRDLQSPARALLFAAGVLAVNEKLSQETRPQVAVIDRFTGSIVGMNQYLYPPLGVVCRELSLVCADLTIELVCDEATRNERLKKRGKPLDPFEIQLMMDAALRETMRSSICDCSSAHVVVDTSGVNPGLATRLCLFHIQRQLPLPQGSPRMDLTAVATLTEGLQESGLSDRDILRRLGRPVESMSEGDIDDEMTSVLGKRSRRRLASGAAMTGTDKRLNVSIAIAGSVAPVAIGGERMGAQADRGSARDLRFTCSELVQKAREEVERVFSDKNASESLHKDAEEALSALEIAAAGGSVQSSELNDALRTLEPLLTTDVGAPTYAGLGQMVAQLV
jgi:thymidylate kinase